ncbi:hypothetical protein V6N13_009389 [Hibiscus sabdariffa]
MAKRKRLNVVSLIGSRAQVEEQRATSAQHQEQSQAQQSEQFEEVQGGGQQSHEEQSQPSLENINRKKVRGATLMSEIWELPKGQRLSLRQLIILIGMRCRTIERKKCGPRSS